MKNKFIIYQFAFSGLLFMCVCSGMHAQNLLQSTLDIDTIVVNQRNSTIDIHLRALNANGKKLLISGTNTKVSELVDDGKGGFISSPVTILNIDSVTYDSLTIIKTLSTTDLLTGTEKYILLESRGLTIRKAYKPIGSFNVPEWIGLMNMDTWLNLVVVGLLAVTALFIILAQFIPIYRNAIFKKKYVVRYRDVQVDGRTRFDPITGEEFEPDDLVVNRCRRMTSLDSWVYNNNQCPDYPACMMEANPCKDGKKNTSNDQFFNQKGPYRILNWVWYGGVGGLSAFFLWALSVYVLAFTDISQSFFQVTSLNIKELILGASLGFGLVFWLSFVEESGQSRTFSWGRILVRAFLGMLVGVLIFALANWGVKYIPFEEDLGQFFANLPTYILLGIGTGLILSMNSSIRTGRSLLGGVVASIIAFSLYFWILKLFGEPEWGRLIGFILFGSLLGALIVSVVYQKGDFALEFISPAKFQRMVPISKWLKAGLEVNIGSDPSSHVFIKWQDTQVAYLHAVLSHQAGGGVILKAMEEVLVNNSVLSPNKTMKLKDGDLIQLGKDSITRLQFIETATDPDDPAYDPKKQQSQASPTYVRPDYSANSNSNIKISRRMSTQRRDE